MSAPATIPRSILFIGALWLAGALVVGATHLLARLPMPLPQLILIALTAVLLIASKVSPCFRDWLSAVNPKHLAAIHLTRFVGAYFLVLNSRGQLPFAFAVPGGIGDIAVATGVMIIWQFDPMRPPGRFAWLTWNILGLIDILFVVATAARLGLADRSSMAALTRLPLSLLPTFVVPIIIASHIFLFRRLWTVGRRRTTDD